MLTSVKGKSSAPVDVQIDFDVQRYLWGDRGVVSEHPGYKLYHKEDFFRFTTLPESWWYYLDLHGQGGFSFKDETSFKLDSSSIH